MKNSYSLNIKELVAMTELTAAILIAVGGFMTNYDKYAGIAAMSVGIIIFILGALIMRGRKKASDEFLKSISKDLPMSAVSVVEGLPIPSAVVHPDGTICWHNSEFAQLVEKENISDAGFERLVPQLKWGYILKNASALNENVEFGGKIYNVRTRLVHGTSDESDKYYIYVYFIDKTKEYKLKKAYENERTDIAVINIDNYDEMLQRVNDTDEQRVISGIRKNIYSWAAQGEAIVKNTDRDKYFVLFEHSYLKNFIEKKFSIIDDIRAVGDEIKVPVSISIGIGAGGDLSKNEAGARNALEMALGRGGDQVCVKDDAQYTFFGGKTGEYEKSTRVKTRSVAVALKDFISQSDKVIFMGHSGADYDCFGAAMGLQRAVRSYKKKPYIIYDNNSPAIDRLYSVIKTEKEYEGMFIDAEEAKELVTADTLLVVLDTHRPSMTAAPELLTKVTKTVLIDHHRRSTEFISPCSLVYHEPYASSVCEMATELIEYMDIGGDVTRMEAESLYTGIIIDTKNFMIKTGVRTFEAASYLKRLGINTMEIKKFFNTNKVEYDNKVDIVKTAEMIAPEMAIARTYKTYPNIRVAASQAADEMLNIGDVKASFVVYPLDGAIGVCARSLGTVNVQLIMEELGGGGHMTVAGAQFKDETVDSVAKMVEDAVNDYFESEEKIAP